jgi:hypothetical protein
MFNISTQNFTQFFVSQNSKGKYESRKILDFVRKNEKKMIFWIFSFLLLIQLLGYFKVYLLIMEFLFFLNILSYKINS